MSERRLHPVPEPAADASGAGGDAGDGSDARSLSRQQPTQQVERDDLDSGKRAPLTERPTVDVLPSDKVSVEVPDHSPLAAPAATPALVDGKPVGAGGVAPAEGQVARPFGRFQLLMQMAQGGMATLFLARLAGPEDFEKLLVIKKIHPQLVAEKDFIRMFMDEARISALIHHPNVVSIYEMGQVDGSHFIAMDYVHGQNLAELFKSSARHGDEIPWTHAARIAASSAAGLHAAHELRSAKGEPMGVVHRDVSPQNLLISYDGHVKVVDFGIAYAAQRITTTAKGILKGKLGYMAPEYASGDDIDRRADIFSLGVVLWEALCLKPLFKAENEAATLRRVLDSKVPKPSKLRPDVPPELDAVVLRATAKRPSDRYDTAEELAEALEQVLVSYGKVVSAKHLATVMEKHFHDRRKLKDEQIRQAMHSSADRPVMGFGMADEDSGLSAVGEQDRFWDERRNTRVYWLIGIGLGLAVALVTLVVLLTFGPWSGGKSSDTSRKQPAMAAPPRPVVIPVPVPSPMERAATRPPPARPATVKLVVKVLPADAKPVTTFRGVQHHGSPFTAVVRRSDKRETVTIRSKGYEESQVDIVPLEDRELTVTLLPATKKKPIPPRRRRRRKRPGHGLLGLPQ